MIRQLLTLSLGALPWVAASAQPLRGARPEPACNPCVLGFERVATLGRSTDSVFARSLWLFVARNSRGEYVVAPVSSPGRIAMYDSTGRLLKTVGRAGAGPGEYQGIRGLLIDRHDSVHVLDVGNARHTVLSPAGTYVRSTPLPARPFDSLILPDGRLVLQALHPTNEQLGLPLHLVDHQGRLVRSFGAQRPESRPDFPTGDVRRVGIAPGGRIWSAYPYQYRIELWDTTGAFHRVLERKVDWFRPWTKESSSRVEVSRPESTLRDVVEDGQGRLLVVVRVADQHWRPDPSANRTGEGRVLHWSERDKYEDSMVELLDATSGRLIGSVRAPMLVSGVLPGGLVYSRRQDDAGDYIDVWRVVVRQP
jgi:hypothetical protein